MDFGSIAAKLTLDISNFTKQLDLAQSQAQQLALKNSKAFNMGDTMTQMGKTFTKALTLPILGIAGASVKVGNEFQYQMSRVQAISGATAKQLGSMKTQAVQLGASTAFSAKEAAQGMENLASAGFQVNEIMDAMPGVLDLAAVSGGDVAASSEAMASSLRAFGLDASKAGHVANVFAKAAADTNAETGDMAYAMKYVAPVAHAMGLSLEETAASIGIMSDAGIKGSQAGTTLRGALSRIAKPTKAMVKSMDALGISFYDASGKMIPLKSQIGLLKHATKDLTQAEKNRHLVTLYGQNSLSGMLALLDAGPEKLDALTKGLENSSGAAQKMAETMQDNLASKIEQMFGAMESAGIIIQQILEPMLSKLVGVITRVVEAFVNMSPVGQKMVVIFGLMVAALGPVLLILGTLITTVVKVKIAMSFLGAGFAGTAGTIGLVIGIIYALVAAFMIAYTKSERFRNFVDNLAPSIKNGIGAAAEWVSNKLKALGDLLSKVGEKLSNFGSSISTKLSGAWSSFTSSIGMAGTSIGQFIGNGLERLGGAFGKLGGVAAIATSIFTKIGLAMLGITGPIGVVIGLIVSFISAWIRTGELNTDGITQVFDNLTNTISAGADMISQYLPIFIEKGTEVIVKFIEGITSKIPEITQKVSEIIQTLVQALVTVLPQLIEAGSQILVSLIQGITQSLPQIVESAITIIDGLLNALLTNLPMLIEAGIQIVTTLLDALVQAIPQLIEAGIQILVKLIEGIVQALPKIVEACVQVITALLNALIAALPMLIDAGIKLITALIEGLIQVIPAVIEAIIQILTALITALIENLPKIIEAGVKLIEALVEGLIKVIPQVIQGIVKIGKALLDALIKHGPSILKAGADLIVALVKGILSILGQVISSGAKLGSQLISKIASFAGQMLSKGASLITSFVSGVGGKIGNAVAKIGSMGSQMISKVSGFVGQMASAGRNFVMGFVNGISGAIGAAASKAAEMASAAFNAAKRFLGIKSPSRKMMKIGKYTGEGFSVGMEKMISTVVDKAEIMAQGVTEAMSGIQMSIEENGIIDKAKSIYSNLQQVIPKSLGTDGYYNLKSLADSPELDLYARKEDGKKDNDNGSDKDPNPGSITIGTIIVRSDDDVDKISRGLYNKSKETLLGMGNIVTT